MFSCLMFKAVLVNIILYKFILDLIKPNRYDLLHASLFTAFTLVILKVLPLNQVTEPLLGITLLVTLLLRYKDDYNITNNILTLCLTLIIITLADALSSAIILKISGQNYTADEFRNSSSLYIALTVLNLIFIICFAFIANRLKKFFFDYARQRNLDFLSYGVATVFLFIAFIYYWLTYNLVDSGVQATSIFIISMTGILLSAILSLFFGLRAYINKLKYQVKNDELDKLQIYSDEVEKNQMALRNYKHDYRNMSLSMKKYIDNEDISGLKDYFYNHFLPYESQYFNQDSRIDKLYYFTQEPINSIIWTKCIETLKQDIKLNIEISEKIMYNATMTDLVEIIGIWFDNALESSHKGDAIHLVAYKENSITWFVLENPLHHNLSIMQLNQVGFTTKGKGRGIGLQKVKNIINNSPNLESATRIEDGYFKQILMVNGE